MSTNLPRYLTYVLKCPILESGLLNALSYVVFMIVNICCGYIADYLINKSFMSTTNLRKFYGFICINGYNSMKI